MSLTIDERVNKGISLLDQYDPYWVNKIDLATLDVKSPGYCVLGQIFARARQGVEILLQNTQLMGKGIGTDCGFFYTAELFANCTSAEEIDAIVKGEYAQLNVAWKSVIRHRKISIRAYEISQTSQYGTPDENWYRAVEEIDGATNGT